MSAPIFIGCCRRCKVSRRFEAPEVGRRAKLDRFNNVVADVTRDVARALPFVGKATAGSHATEYSDRRGSLWLVCPVGHNVEFKRLRGTVTAKACGARCMSSTGPSCECACGGHNHGANHEAAS